MNYDWKVNLHGALKSICKDNTFKTFDDLEVGDFICEITVWVGDSSRRKNRFSVEFAKIKNIYHSSHEEDPYESYLWETDERNYFCNWDDYQRTWLTYGDGDRVPSSYSCLLVDSRKLTDAIDGLIQRVKHPFYGKESQCVIDEVEADVSDFIKEYKAEIETMIPCNV